MQNDLASLDVHSIISLQVGSRSANGIVRIDEAALEFQKRRISKSIPIYMFCTACATFLR